MLTLLSPWIKWRPIYDKVYRLPREDREKVLDKFASRSDYDESWRGRYNHECLREVYEEHMDRELEVSGLAGASEEYDQVMLEVEFMEGLR